MTCVGCLFGGATPIGEVPPDSTPRNRIFSRDYIQCRHCKLRRPPANPRFSIYAAGWLLLPAYRRIGTGLEFNSSENDNSLDFDLVFSFTLYCRLESPRRGQAYRFRLEKTCCEIRYSQIRTRCYGKGVHVLTINRDPFIQDHSAYQTLYFICFICPLNNDSRLRDCISNLYNSAE